MSEAQFDYIIVGAGSAGCLLANRLSANSGNKVLLLEAGKDDNNPLIKMPIGFTRLMYDEGVTNLYKTQPEPHFGNREVSVVRGRVVGGCSSINGMVYTRGQREDYDSWARLPGCDGWSFEELLPYFKKPENYEVESDNPYHGNGGELNVTNVEMKYPISQAYIDAAVSIGIPRNDDLNSGNQEGIGYMQVNMKAGRRWSSADAFLTKDVRRRPNLNITLNAHAERVLFDGRRAVGVEYTDKKGKKHTARAAREVVLAAGAYNSPALLEMSGVGQRDVLQRLGVDMLKEMRGLGENLQDHAQVWLQQGVTTKQTLSEDGKFPKVVWNVFRYMFTKTGPLAFPAANVGAFIRSENDPRPIFQLHFTPGAGGMDAEGNMVASEQSGVNSTVCVTRPSSRGSVHAATTDPKDHPVIIHNFLSTERDRRLSIEGFRLQRKIYAAEPFAKYAAEELIPGPLVQSDDEILDFWGREGMSTYHPVGTAKMGEANDPDAVVDNQLRVHGLDSLRIVDASIFPQIPSGNTHAPVVAVAEKAAELILANA